MCDCGSRDCGCCNFHGCGQGWGCGWGSGLSSHCSGSWRRMRGWAGSRGWAAFGHCQEGKTDYSLSRAITQAPSPSPAVARASLPQIPLNSGLECPPPQQNWIVSGHLPISC